MSDFRETLYTIDTRGNRKWVYPVDVLGYFRNRRTIVASILLLFYLSMPWISIGGSQAIYLDIFHRRFIFYGATFWATDTKFLLLVLATLGFSLFFFTALLGRVWCGWACPETVFLEFVFRPIERLIEGNASARRKLDRSPWTIKKIRLKATKYFLFSVIAWALSSTLLAYFIGRERLLTMMSDYPWMNWPTFLITLAFMGVILFQFGWFREQFCTVVCPYARFQSVLLDDSSLLVGYDTARGEPRGKVSESGRGDCVDCELCVKVCPTGIDIRNGLQLECIQCAACADACDSVMTKIGRATGLVRYDTEKGLKGEKISFYRPRVLLYGSILAFVFAFLGLSLGTRELSEVSVFHSSKDSLYSKLKTGELTNHLELSLSNKSDTERRYTAKIEEIPEMKIVLPIDPFPVPPNSLQKVPLFLTFGGDILTKGKRTVHILVSDNMGFSKRIELELVGPG